MTEVPSSAAATVRTLVEAHPWRTLGSAFLIGAWLGLDPPHAPRNRLLRSAYAMVGSLAIRVARDAALRDLIARTVRPETHPAEAHN
jgi:hypothetical protein